MHSNFTCLISFISDNPLLLVIWNLDFSCLVFIEHRGSANYSCILNISKNNVFSKQYKVVFYKLYKANIRIAQQPLQADEALINNSSACRMYPHSVRVLSFLTIHSYFFWLWLFCHWYVTNKKCVIDKCRFVV